MSNDVTNQRSPEAANLQLTFRDDVTQPELRRVVERSVGTLVARSAETFQQAHVEAATREKLLAAVNAPLLRLIESDPAAVTALDELRKRQLYDPESRRQLSDVESSTSLRTDTHTTGLGAIDDLARFVRLEAPGAREVRALAVRPPYEYTWSWFDPAGVAPFRQLINNEIGRVLLDAGAGPEIAGRQFVGAHAGFGVTLTTDHESLATGYASCRQRWEYLLEPWVTADGSYHTSRAVGYMEFTAWEDGRALASAPLGFPISSETVFSATERAPDRDSQRGGPADVHVPRSLAFIMRPGRVYNFNVGLVTYVENFRRGRANAFMDGDVSLIAVSRT